jgi:Na+/melibiose symporter-like transporter
MFDLIADRIRRSDINYRLLLPLLLSSAAVQTMVAVVRVTTSYRIVELDLPVVWLGIISAAYAILPAFIALRLGRFIDRGHDALATWIGAVLMVVASGGLLASGASKILLLAFTALLAGAHYGSSRMLFRSCSGSLLRSIPR